MYGKKIGLSSDWVLFVIPFGIVDQVTFTFSINTLKMLKAKYEISVITFQRKKHF